jgi:hypothetical protein
MKKGDYLYCKKNHYHAISGTLLFIFGKKYQIINIGKQITLLGGANISVRYLISTENIDEYFITTTKEERKLKIKQLEK